MSLGADLAAALPGLRTQAESRMTDRCSVVSNPGVNTWDPETLTNVEASPTYSYIGPCRVKAGSTQPSAVDAVGQALVQTQLEVHLPVATSTAVRVDHVIVITKATADPGLLGRRYRVTGPHNQSASTARRFPVEEITGG